MGVSDGDHRSVSCRMSSERPKRTRLRAKSKPRTPQLTDEAASVVEATIRYVFKDKALLHRAMTHPSAITTEDLMHHANQRLEFLGDRVLGLVISERLLERFPTDSEGDMAPKLNALVNKTVCARAMGSLGAGEHLIMGRGEIKAGGRERESTLGDLCEAVIGAIYLDGGLKAARNFIELAWASEFSRPLTPIRNSKSELQEWALGKGVGLPTYKTTGQSGPDHAPIFEVTVSLENGLNAAATGSSKQDAGRAAAEKLLEQIGDD